MMRNPENIEFFLNYADFDPNMALKAKSQDFTQERHGRRQFIFDKKRLV